MDASSFQFQVVPSRSAFVRKHWNARRTVRGCTAVLLKTRSRQCLAVHVKGSGRPESDHTLGCGICYFAFRGNSSLGRFHTARKASRDHRTCNAVQAPEVLVPTPNNALQLIEPFVVSKEHITRDVRPLGSTKAAQNHRFKPRSHGLMFNHPLEQ